MYVEINFDLSDPTFPTETQQIPVLLTKKPYSALHIWTISPKSYL